MASGCRCAFRLASRPDPVCVFKGKGNLQPGTGRRGDLYLNLEVQAHPVWRLDGDQLRGELPVSLDELALGGTVTVMTPDGEAEVSIPAGTAPGRSLRLKGKGWPMKSGRGDLLLSLSLQLAEAWSGLKNSDPCWNSCGEHVQKIRVETGYRRPSLTEGGV